MFQAPADPKRPTGASAIGDRQPVTAHRPSLYNARMASGRRPWKQESRRHGGSGDGRASGVERRPVVIGLAVLALALVVVFVIVNRTGDLPPSEQPAVTDDTRLLPPPETVIVTDDTGPLAPSDS